MSNPFAGFRYPLGLEENLEVRSEIILSGAFTERIVYKDWLKDTAIEITITETGQSAPARSNWQRLGITPWAWRYTPLTDRSHPHFTFILDRRARITITGRRAGHEFGITTEQDRKANDYRFSRCFRFNHKQLRWLPAGFVIPRFTILRPQYVFSPLTQRPDQVHELVSHALIYFPRNSKTRDGAVKTWPIRYDDLAEIKKQVAKFEPTGRINRHDRFTGQPVKGSEYTITSSGEGHVISSVEGEYVFEITPAPVEGSNNAPPAYNFEFSSTPIERQVDLGQLGVRMVTWDEVRLYVHRTASVLVRQQIETSAALDAEVCVRTENTTRDVGYLGDPITSKKGFEPLDEEGHTLENILFGLFTLALTAIPVWGWVAGFALTVGELVYTYHTGRDFFDDKVSPKALAAMGIMGILGAAGDVIGGLRVLKGNVLSLSNDFDVALQAAFRQYSNEYNLAVRGSVEAIDAVGDNPIAKLIASLNSKQRQQLVADAARLDSPDEYLEVLRGHLDQQLASLAKADSEQYQQVFASILDPFLTPDGKTFTNQFLREAYEAFRRNPRVKKTRSPLEWLRTQKSKPVVAFLKNALGDDYSARIGAAIQLARGRKVVMATSENISQVFEVYDDFMALGLTQYQDLHLLWHSIKYDDVRALMRDCFEREHPLELRFARNLDGIRKRHVKPSGEITWGHDKKPLEIDVEMEFQAFLVPRTPRHAVLLAEAAEAGKLKQGSALLYTQHPKTGNVRKLIPHGAEHLATPQEIADAVCTELLRVNFDKIGKAGEIDKIMDRLEKDFETLTDLINRVRNKKYKIPVLMRNLDEINPALVPGAPGWARFKRSSATGQYVEIVNLHEVENARLGREIWAEQQRQLKAKKK